MRKRTRNGIIVAVVLTVLAGATLAVAPWLLTRLGGVSALPWGPQCGVATGEGEIALSGAEARLLTTLAVRDHQGRDVDLDRVPRSKLPAWERLRDGPPDDAGPSLTCRTSRPDDLAAEEPTDSGLTPRAERLRAAMGEVFGEQSLGGFRPGGIDSGHGEDSAHYDGRAIDVFYRPVTEENRREGWLLAHWLLAHAEELDIAVIIFDDRIWSSLFSVAGWRDYRSPDPDNEILRHLDHVHVDVIEGT